MQENLVGKRLDGRYEIQELIGTGGMADVYKAYDNVDDRIVAIKILKDEFLANDEFRRRFKNESKAIAVLSHPNIVKVHDVSFGDVIQYIVMEYINGITLKDYIKQQGIIPWKDALHFASQVLKALQQAHDKGIVHRDIKPQNIMLLPNGTVKVTDFGIARFARNDQRSITEKAIGSVHYISPEQARGDFTDGKADIYSVGVLLYEMTTGRVPFQADSAVSVAIMQLQNEPTKPSEINSLIPTGLEEIILKAMQKNPKCRYQSADSMLSDINILLSDPATIFSYEYNDSDDLNVQKTKIVDVPEQFKYIEQSEPEETTKKRAPIIPVLSAIAGVFVIGIIVVLVYVFNFFDINKTTIECPNFIGKNYNELASSDEFKNYNIELSDEMAVTEYERGYIYKQSPEPGRKINANSEITLFVSSGKAKIQLQNYSNEVYEIVKQEIEELGLVIKPFMINDDTVEAGHIIKTVPPAGAEVSPGDELTVYISEGKKVNKNYVPDVVGMTKDDAKKDIEDTGFRLGSVKKDFSDTMPEGLIISQYPEYGNEAEYGSAISVVISKGPKPEETQPPEPIDKEVYFNVVLPSSNSTVDLTVYVDGILDNSKTATIDLSSRSSYDFSLFGTSESSSVKVKINGADYMIYTVNFQTGATSSKMLDVSSVLSQNAGY